MEEQNILTCNDEQLANVLNMLHKANVKAQKMTETYRPTLGGERYGTDVHFILRWALFRHIDEEKIPDSHC